MISFKSLDVYRAAIAFLRLVVRVLTRVPRSEKEARDQLRRAAMSISLNIGEGAGCVSRPDANRFYAIARGSAMECAAMMDVCHSFDWIDESLHREAEDLLERIVAMLTKMTR